MMNCMGICMTISLDTNVWIFGLFENDTFCERILDNLSQFEIVVPNQVSTLTVKFLYTEQEPRIDANERE